MRLLALVGLVALLSGCGVGVEEEVGAPVSERTELGAPESWCRSYTSAQFCPKYICSWNGSICTLPPESAAPEEATQMGPSERWCNSYTTQQYCPSVCAWHSSPAPGRCGLKASSLQ